MEPFSLDPLDGIFAPADEAVASGFLGSLEDWIDLRSIEAAPDAPANIVREAEDVAAEEIYEHKGHMFLVNRWKCTKIGDRYTMTIVQRDGELMFFWVRKTLSDWQGAQGYADVLSDERYFKGRTPNAPLNELHKAQNLAKKPSNPASRYAKRNE